MTSGFLQWVGTYFSPERMYGGLDRLYKILMLRKRLIKSKFELFTNRVIDRTTPVTVIRVTGKDSQKLQTITLLLQNNRSVTTPHM